jgi:undecaprenyl-diphosphatase
MSLLDAVIMGVIQGLTEFLPVSSSGHLAIFRNIFGIKTETGLLFDVMLHLGTLIAVFIVYYKDIFKMVKEGIGLFVDVFTNTGLFIQNKTKNKEVIYRKVVNNGYRKFALLIIVSTIPTAVIGYMAQELVTAAAQLLFIPGICLLITATLLFISDRLEDGTKTPKNVTYTTAFGIGICQGIATMPGLSRSGTTIAACLISGFNRKLAVKYSFLMSIPAILGASILELKDFATIKVTPQEVAYYFVGTLIATVVGYICIKSMLIVVRKKKFTFFAIYCLLIGLFSIGGYFVLS